MIKIKNPPELDLSKYIPIQNSPQIMYGLPEEILFSNTPPFLPSKNYDYKRGLILKEVIKNQNSLTLNEINYNYN